MTGRLARVAVAVVAVAALSGCVRFTSTQSFGTDNTVTQDIIVALTEDAATQVGIDLDDLTAAAVLSEGDAAFPDIDPSKITVEDYTEGDRKGVHIIARDLTLDEFNASATQGTAASAAAGGLSTPMTVVREGDTYIVTIPADPARDLSEVRGSSSIGLISSSIDFSITLSFPGPVKSATAGRVDGKTVVLGLEDLLTPDEIVIRGQATPGIAWGPILKWLAIGGTAVVIISGATLLVVQDRRRQRQRNLPPIEPQPDGDEGAVPEAGSTDSPGGSPEVTPT